MPVLNPIALTGRIERCWLLTFETSPHDVASLLPEPLELVTWHGRTFWNVVVCRVRRMRPWPLPAWCGVSYWHVAYRLYARFRPARGEPIEGLYFLRSDCSSRLMVWGGRRLTDLRFHSAKVSVEEQAGLVNIDVTSPGGTFNATLNGNRAAELPADSGFSTLDEAAQALKYHPAALAVEPDGRVNVLRIGRDESAWRSRLLAIEQFESEFLAGCDVRPEICYEVQPINYFWHRGQSLAAATNGVEAAT